MQKSVISLSLKNLNIFIFYLEISNYQVPKLYVYQDENLFLIYVISSGEVILKKWFLCPHINIILFLHFSIISHWKRHCLSAIHQRMWCAKLGWNWSCSKEDECEKYANLHVLIVSSQENTQLYWKNLNIDYKYQDIPYLNVGTNSICD